MQKLRWNKDEAHSVARKLINSKRQELKAGGSGKDVMSLLGLSSIVSPPLTWLLRAPVKSSDSQREDQRLTNEEVIS